MIVVDPDQDRPDASSRRKMVEAEQRCKRLRMALVTESAAARGVVTALQWLTGSRDSVSRSTHATLDEAVAVLERETGRRLPRIQRLHDAVRAELAAAAGPLIATGRRR